MNERDEVARGLGFGRAAAEYTAGRPGYPAASVAWLLGDARRIADVGAGTGKLTAALVEAGAEVVAVEPDGGMRAELARTLPAVAALPGTAEALPLADASVDAAVLGQAWHWVDVPRASAEAARVLRPAGALGLIWNVRDESAEWVARLGEVMGSSAAERMILTDQVRVGPPFGPLERHEERWSRPMTSDRVVAMVASRSSVIALEEPQRRRLLDDVRDLLRTHPQTAGRSNVDLPYVTTAFRALRP